MTSYKRGCKVERGSRLRNHRLCCLLREGLPEGEPAALRPERWAAAVWALGRGRNGQLVLQEQRQRPICWGHWVELEMKLETECASGVAKGPIKDSCQHGPQVGPGRAVGKEGKSFLGPSGYSRQCQTTDLCWLCSSSHSACSQFLCLMATH